MVIAQPAAETAQLLRNAHLSRSSEHSSLALLQLGISFMLPFVFDKFSQLAMKIVIQALDLKERTLRRDQRTRQTCRRHLPNVTHRSVQVSTCLLVKLAIHLIYF